jgi:hypothetical protein
VTDVVTRVIPEERLEGRPLGRNVEHDPRSRDHAFAAAEVVLRKVRHLRRGAVLNQGSVGACTGFATAGAVNTAPVWQRGNRLLVNADALWLYEQATIVDGFPGAYPPDDTGSSGLAACKAAKARGWISGYQHAFGVSQALQALMGTSVIVGVNWYEGFDRPDVNGRVQITGQVRGGHECEIVGYDPATDLLEGINSWGVGFGKAGHFFFDAHSTFARLLAEQGDVQIPIR